MGRERTGSPAMAKSDRDAKESPMGAARSAVERGYARAEAARRLGVSVCSGRPWIDSFGGSDEGPT